jgi:hypothetical protein
VRCGIAQAEGGFGGFADEGDLQVHIGGDDTDGSVDDYVLKVTSLEHQLYPLAEFERETARFVGKYAPFRGVPVMSEWNLSDVFCDT